MVGETFDSGQVFTEAVDDFTALFYSDRVFIGAREYPIGQCVVDILNLEESELFRIDQILMEFFIPCRKYGNKILRSQYFGHRKNCRMYGIWYLCYRSIGT